jgi:hypothetical protein
MVIVEGRDGSVGEVVESWSAIYYSKRNVMTLRLLWDTDPRGEKTVIERARYHSLPTVAPNSYHNDSGQYICY